MIFLDTTIKIIDPIVKALGSNGEWLAGIDTWSIIVRLMMAVVFGGIVGVERGTKRQAAGLRTYILVSVGSAVVMITNQFIHLKFDGDIARLGAQVISGIGFLGAGTILITSRNQIRGLTTAAGLWASACMGLSIGIGFYTLSIAAFVLIMLIIVLLPKFEKAMILRSDIHEYHVEFLNENKVKEFIEYARSIGANIKRLEEDTSYKDTGLFVYVIILELASSKELNTHSDLLENFKKLDYLYFIKEV